MNNYCFGKLNSFKYLKNIFLKGGDGGALFIHSS